MPRVAFRPDVVVAVWDLEDTPETARAVSRLNAPPHTIVAEVGPLPKRHVNLLRPIQEALGLDPMIVGATGFVADWALARAWLAASGVRQLICWRAHLLPPRLVAELAGLGALAGVQIVLILHDGSTSESLRDAVEHWAPQKYSLAKYIAARPFPSKHLRWSTASDV